MNMNNNNFVSYNVEKPWGYEQIWAKTNNYVGKILFIKHKHRLSLQYHKEKEETIYVQDGILTLQIDKDDITLSAGSYYHIAPGIIHRMSAKYGDCKVFEVSTPQLDDVIRLDDDYKRIC